MTGGPARSLCLLVEPHQLVHQLIDAVAGLRGELLDRRRTNLTDLPLQVDGEGTRQTCVSAWPDGTSASQNGTTELMLALPVTTDAP
jgi:hypothetical protein